MLELADELAGPLSVVSGAGAEGFVVAEAGLGVEEGVLAAPGTGEGYGGVEAGPPRTVAVVLTLTVMNGLLEMSERHVSQPGVTVFIAERMVNDGEIPDGVIGDQFERLVVGADGVVEVGEEFLFGRPCLEGIVEPFVGDVAELADGAGAAEGVVLFEPIQPALVPVLGLVEVAQGGDLLVRAAEVEREGGFLLLVADPLG